MAARFEKRDLKIRHFQAWSKEHLTSAIGEADVLVISGMWHNKLLQMASKLKFIQSISAGYDQFPLNLLQDRKIRLASARGVNRNAVSEHVLAYILGFARQIHTGRDNQQSQRWRGLISDLSKREQEMKGMTLLIIGMGTIGSRIAHLAKAFEMRILATKRNLQVTEGPADEVHSPESLPHLLPRADFVVLTCPLTSETEMIINQHTLSLMKESAYLINVARGLCVDEQALLEALSKKTIAGAGIDCFPDEPLSQSSPFWNLKNVLITPHTAGETQKYEDNVLDILMENINRLARGETELLNQIV